MPAWRAARRNWPRRSAAWGALVAALALGGGAALAADLPPVERGPIERPRSVLPPVHRYVVVPEATSTNGYYGYYGYDILGRPYEGLYSENPVCIQSVLTPDGYRTVDACR